MIGTQTPTQLRLAANRQVSRRDAILRSMALVHGELSVKAHILRGLWRSGQRAEAHVLLRFFTTGSFTRGSDGLAAPPRSIECRAVKGPDGPQSVRVPRWEIALFVNDLLYGLRLESRRYDC